MASTITTPIYYVNDSPHIGHAYTTIAADFMARYQRLQGQNVFFLTGTDEHGQKVDKAAQLKGVSPQALCDDVSQRFRALVHTGENILNISNDDFIRTTEARHKKSVQAFWQRIQQQSPDAIYKDNYGGWYSVRDEAYYQESELIEKEGKKLAPTGAEVEWVEEESYFFRLSAYQDRLLELYANHPDFVFPQSRMNEVKSFVQGGLKDLSISRTTFNWGVPVPDAPGHVMYVWIDALANYITALGYPEDTTQRFHDFWGETPALPGHAVHFVGKDIVRFHAVYWPAFLMAANLPLPKQIVAHGWWTIEGEKMSKSLGNVLSPADIIARTGGIDQMRYGMLRAMPFGNDGDFVQDRMIEIINADLANNIGNLAQRTLSMIFKNCAETIPAPSDVQPQDTALMQHVQQLSIAPEMAVYDYQGALEKIVQAANKANEYIDQNAPWTLRKEGNQARMETVLYTLAEVARCIAIHLLPFCPRAADALLQQLAVPETARNLTALSQPLAHGIKINAPQGVFPRVEKQSV